MVESTEAGSSSVCKKGRGGSEVTGGTKKQHQRIYIREYPAQNVEGSTRVCAHELKRVESD